MRSRHLLQSLSSACACARILTCVSAIYEASCVGWARGDGQSGYVQARCTDANELTLKCANMQISRCAACVSRRVSAIKAQAALEAKLGACKVAFASRCCLRRHHTATPFALQSDTPGWFFGTHNVTHMRLPSVRRRFTDPVERQSSRLRWSAKIAALRMFLPHLDAAFCFDSSRLAQTMPAGSCTSSMPLAYALT